MILQKNLPKYQNQLKELTESGFEFAEKHNLPVSKSQILQNFDIGTVMGYAQEMLSGIGGILSKAFLIFVIVAFILFETSSFPRKLANINLIEGETNASANVFTGKIKRYLAIKQ